MIKACIFDMDGTTVNTIDSISHFANSALIKYNLKPIEKERYKLIVGNGAKILVERMIDISGGTDSDFKKVYDEYNTSYDNNFLYLTRPYDLVLEMLKELNTMGIDCAILSNKPHNTAKKVSDALFGDSLIKICLGGRDNVKLKPDPAGVIEIMDKLGVKKDECIYIGDTATDMQTGKNSGLYTVGVLWGFRGREELILSGADAIINSPLELIDIIRQNNG